MRWEKNNMIGETIDMARVWMDEVMIGKIIVSNW